ncbi:MAG: cytochrome P450 [Proteobacteria bacterium]|nr:cytochrome P450 [Pseudomonadota bacterium]
MTDPLAVFRRPPGPDGPVALGADAETLRSLEKLQRSYGNVVAVTTPNGRQAFFLNDPEDIRRILVTNHSKYIKGPGFERVKLLLGNGLIVSDGAAWRRSRTMVTPAFTRRNLHKLISMIVQCCEQKSQRWAKLVAAEEPVNITKEMADYALELILRAIFGPAFDSKIIADGDNPFAFLSQDSSRDLKFVLRLRALRELVLSIIDERRHAGPVEHCDFLSMYMSAEDKSGEKYSDDELLNEVMTLIIAGFETSSGILNWAWYLIARHPTVDAKLFKEARQQVPDADLVNSQSIAELKYLHQVLDETMRLYPPVWLFSRHAIRDDTLADYDIPAGTDIYISPYILQHTEQYWPDPEKFDPDRFAAPETREKKDRRQAAHIPFSLGPRRCIGEYLAFLEMKVHLGLLLQQFQMTTTTDMQPELDIGVNLRTKEDIYLRPTLRTLNR